MSDLGRLIRSVPRPLIPQTKDRDTDRFYRMLLEYIDAKANVVTNEIIRLIPGITPPPGGGGSQVLFVGGPSSLESLTAVVNTTEARTYDVSYTLAANTLSATNHGLRITAIVEDNFVNGGTNVATRFRFGGTTIVTGRRGVLGSAFDEITVHTTLLYRRSSTSLEGTSAAITGRTNTNNGLVRADQGSGTVDFTVTNVIDVNADLVVLASGTSTSRLRLLMVEALVPD